MGYRVVGEVAMAVHFAFLGYVALGGFLAWRWPWAVWPHLFAVGWGLGTVLVGLPCPLTDVEDWGRRRAGQQGLPRGFVDQYLEGVVYPERYTATLRWAVASVVAISWLGAYLLARRRRRPGGPWWRWSRPVGPFPPATPGDTGAGWADDRPYRGGPVMKAKVGDRLIMEGTHVGDKRRRGIVIALRHEDGSPPYLVRWLDDDHEGLVYPGPDARIETTGDPD